MEKRNILVSSRKLGNFSLFLSIPLSPLESLAFHVANKVGKSLDAFETFNCRPNSFREEFHRFSLVRYIKSNLFLNESHNFDFINLLLSDQNSQAEHSSNEKFVALEKTSSRVVEALISDRINKGFDSLAKRARSHRLIFLIFFFFSCSFTFFARFLNCLLRIHSLSYDIDSAVDDNNEGIERELVERVDLVEFDHEEEHKGTTTGSWAISLGSVVNHDLGHLGNLDLLLDLSGDLLGVLEVLNEVNVFENITLGIGKSEEKVIFELLQLDLKLV